MRHHVGQSRLKLYFLQQLLVLLLVLQQKLKLAGLAKKLISTLVIAWREARQPEIKKKNMRTAKTSLNSK